MVQHGIQYLDSFYLVLSLAACNFLSWSRWLPNVCHHIHLPAKQKEEVKVYTLSLSLLRGHRPCCLLCPQVYHTTTSSCKEGRRQNLYTSTLVDNVQQKKVIIKNWVFITKILKMNVGEPLPVSAMMAFKVLQESALPLPSCS